MLSHTTSIIRLLSKEGFLARSILPVGDCPKQKGLEPLEYKDSGLAT